MTGEDMEPQRAQTASADVDPAEAAGLLSDMRQLRSQARSARHAYWFPLVLFALLTFAAIPFYVMPKPKEGISITTGPPSLLVLGGNPGLPLQNYLGYYWLAALLGGLALTLWWYRRHARRIGLRTPARGYLITVIVLTVIALVLPFLAQLGPFSFPYFALPGDLLVRGMFPFLIIAVGLCVLAWAERSRALGLIAVLYTGTALLVSLYDLENVLFRLGWNPSPDQWQFTDLPNVLLPAVVLLMAGIGAFVVQRRQQRAA
jgi:hypothetical protein